jgi:hypothetical protein
MSEENKSYIARIYNYCDRWCEKCKYTAHCLLFTNESKIVTQQILKPGETLDIEKIFNMDFDKYQDELQDEMLDRASENGEEQENINEEDDVEINKHPISKLADQFFLGSHLLIKRMDERYNFYALSNKRRFDPHFNSVFEEFEIFVWFHSLITAKIKRAISGKIEMLKDDDEDMISIREYDMNGSAKISIIVLEKTIKALNKLFNEMPEFKDDISSLQVIAGELLNMTEKEFPGYNSFIRPGFDE